MALRSQVYAVTSLIRGAIFLPKFESHNFGRTYLNIFPLHELIDRYHRHEVTRNHDRIYALLGINSSNIDDSGILPINYQISWKELSCRLFQFLLGKETIVKSEGNADLIHIYAKASVLGYVKSVTRNADGHQALYMNWGEGATDLLRSEPYDRSAGGRVFLHHCNFPPMDSCSGCGCGSRT